MKTINISDGGVFFDSRNPVPLGTEVFISFSTAKCIEQWVEPQKLEKIKGAVCRSDKLGLAVEFKEKQDFSKYLVIEDPKKLRVLAPF